MYWTLELAHHLEDAPWPASRDELIDYAVRSGAPLEVMENLQGMEDEVAGVLSLSSALLKRSTVSLNTWKDFCM